MNRPETNEFAPYYNTYVSTVEGNNVMPVLESQTAELRSIFSGMPEEKGTFAYAEGKWTLKEALSHLIDGERIFAYRILPHCAVTKHRSRDLSRTAISPLQTPMIAHLRTCSTNLTSSVDRISSSSKTSLMKAHAGWERQATIRSRYEHWFTLWPAT